MKRFIVIVSLICICQTQSSPFNISRLVKKKESKQDVSLSAYEVQVKDTEQKSLRVHLINQDSKMIIKTVKQGGNTVLTWVGLLSSGSRIVFMSRYNADNHAERVKELRKKIVALKKSSDESVEQSHVYFLRPENSNYTKKILRHCV